MCTALQQAGDQQLVSPFRYTYEILEDIYTCDKEGLPR